MLSVVSVAATFVIQCAYILLPAINDVVTSVRPPEIGIVPRPIASGVCWTDGESQYKEARVPLNACPGALFRHLRFPLPRDAA